MDIKAGDSEGTIERRMGGDVYTVFSRPAWPEFEEGSFLVRFARDDHDLRRVQRLRFEVFNLELKEGLTESHRLGLDRDRFDEACDHMMVIDRSTEQLIGTYRMQTWLNARRRLGFYSAGEFTLDALPASVLHRSIELGRACIERSYRHGHALFALWRGLAAYASWTGERYLLGCCSLTSQDPCDGLRMERRLRAEGRMHPDFVVRPHPEVRCEGEIEAGDDEAPKVPRLFATYLRYGALACGPPAIDREFGTVDFLVLLDLAGLDVRIRTLFFAGLPKHRA